MKFFLALFIATTTSLCFAADCDVVKEQFSINLTAQDGQEFQETIDIQITNLCKKPLGKMLVCSNSLAQFNGEKKCDYVKNINLGEPKMYKTVGDFTIIGHSPISFKGGCENARPLNLNEGYPIICEVL